MNNSDNKEIAKQQEIAMLQLRQTISRKLERLRVMLFSPHSMM